MELSLYLTQKNPNPKTQRIEKKKKKDRTALQIHNEHSNPKDYNIYIRVKIHAKVTCTHTESTA